MKITSGKSVSFLRLSLEKLTFCRRFFLSLIQRKEIFRSKREIDVFLDQFAKKKKIVAQLMKQIWKMNHLIKC